MSESEPSLKGAQKAEGDMSLPVKRVIGREAESRKEPPIGKRAPFGVSGIERVAGCGAAPSLGARTASAETSRRRHGTGALGRR